MKALSIPIQVIASFDKEGTPTPMRFKMESEGQEAVIKVETVMHREEQRFGKNKIYIFRCKSVIDNIEKVYDLKFDVANCRWTLFRM